MRENKEKSVSIRLPISLYDAIQEVAEKEETTTSAFIRRAIKEYIDNEYYKLDEISIEY